MQNANEISRKKRKKIMKNIYLSCVDEAGKMHLKSAEVMSDGAKFVWNILTLSGLGGNIAPLTFERLSSKN